MRLMRVLAAVVLVGLLGVSGLAQSGVQFAVITATQVNAEFYASKPFTPVAGEKLLVLVSATGTAGGDDPLALTDTTNGLYTRVALTTKSPTGADRLYAFLRNSPLPSGPFPMHVRFVTSPDRATGCILAVLRIPGTSTVRQVAVSPSIPGGETPTVTFDQPVLADSLLVAWVTNHSNDAIVAPPAGFSAHPFAAHDQPSHGGNLASRSGGWSGVFLMWGSATETNAGAIALEIVGG